MTAQEISKKYRKIRRSLDWTQRDVARKTGVSAATVSNFEVDSALVSEQKRQLIIAVLEEAALIAA